MKITNNDIKTLEKIKKLCDKRKCKECEFYFCRDCILQYQPNWWELDNIEVKSNKEEQ